MADSVLKEIDGPIARVILNRPEARNAMDPECCARLVEHLRAVEADPAIRCVILTGAGAHFMAGADLNEFKETLADPSIDLRSEFERRVVIGGNQFPTILERMKKPVISMIRGGAAGGGFGMALASDFVVCSETAFFAAAHIMVGLCPDNGTAWYLTRLIGERAAKKILMLGQRIDAAEALRIGMIDQVVPDAELEAATQKLAEQLIAMPPKSLAHIKTLVNGAARRSLTESLQLEAECIGDCAADPNFREGVAAFLERRKPVFR